MDATDNQAGAMPTVQIVQVGGEMRKADNIVGKKFNRLLVLERAESGGHIKPRWLCICDCGNRKIVNGASLKNGGTKSCGCYLKENRKYCNYKSGHSAGENKKEYQRWSKMRSRCLNPKDKSFKDYGGRGIGICTEWESSFEQYLSDMGHAPSSMELDRVDNDKGYSKENCRWASRKQNMRNTRHNTPITVGGIKYGSIAELSEKVDFPVSIIHDRIKNGWPNDSLLSPVKNILSPYYKPLKIQGVIF